MKLLLIDTCGTTGSIALAETAPEPALLASALLPGRTASERLVPAINSLFIERGETLQSLGAIAVVHGPGSFTGVRVGLAAAKGLSEALAVPLIAISRLAVLAQLGESSALAPNSVYALLDAGRGDLYLGHYSGTLCHREALLARDELLAFLAAADSSDPTRKPLIVVCETSLAESLASHNPILVAEPSAADALRLALQRSDLGSFDDTATLDANYLRRTDAQIFAKPTPKSVAATSQ
jgi:tRNA threonylcarbamoyladenosine biosynthesis protein TsaB